MGQHQRIVQQRRSSGRVSQRTAGSMVKEQQVAMVDVRRLEPGMVVALRCEADPADAALVRPPMTPNERQHLQDELGRLARPARAMFNRPRADSR